MMITAEGRLCLDILGPLNGTKGQCSLIERTVGSDVAVTAGMIHAGERVRGYEDISAMCFSATASFTAAAVTGSIGALTLRSAAAKHDYQALPIAAFPLLFAAQQLTEGFLWLDLASPEPGMHRTILIQAFQGYAVVFWPVFAPLAAFLIEPERRRRRLILHCLAVGALLSAYLLTTMVAHPYYAFVGSGHIVYENDF